MRSRQPRRMRTPAMIEFLAALSVLALMLGLGTMTKATLGVALIATAVWFAVMQRVLQARRHHAAIVALLRKD